MSVSRALGLGAISGLRSLSGPAFVCGAASHGHLDLDGTVFAFLGSPRISKVLTLMELGELVGDKLPATPSRTSPPPLLGRAASGALVGAVAFVSEGRRATIGAALGSTAAIIAAFAGERLRALAVEKTDLPDPVVALAEDATVLLVGLRSLKNIRQRGPMAEERDRLRMTFDGAALYDEVRPGYPEDLFDDIVSLSGIPAGGRILEIGCGTGQATVPFARRGYRILCIELGENMAAVARRNLKGFPNAEVRTGAFEDTSSQEGAFDLAISATAFHWLDPAVAYPKTARALRVGGSLALFWNVHVHSDASEGFFEAAQRIYEREAPEIVGPEDYKGLPRPHEAPDRTEEIQNTGFFGSILTRHQRWDETYDAEGYLRVLNTYSGHRSLNDDTREHLFRGIADLIDYRFNGRIVKGYLTTLYVAKRK